MQHQKAHHKTAKTSCSKPYKLVRLKMEEKIDRFWKNIYGLLLVKNADLSPIAV